MSQTNFHKVQDFNRSFGLSVPEIPRPHVFTEDPKLTKLRLSLIQEEVGELEQACQDHDFTEVADAIGDILYVVYGMASSFGLDADEIFDRVHSSNMSKLDDKCKPIYREDGKVLKSDNYKPPSMKGLV